MRVASYNIRKAVGLDWRRDPHRVVDVLAEVDADIVVLQEADRRVGARGGVLPLDRLENELGYTLADLSIRPLSHGWHGNAFLLRGPYSARSTSRIDLPSVESRGAVAVLLEAPKLEIIGVHLGLTPGMRGKQMTALEKVMSERAHPVLIAGDFNEWNERRMPFSSPATTVSPGFSFHTARPRAALDKFILSGGLHARSSHVHISPLSRQASDHFPIIIDLETGEPQK